MSLESEFLAAETFLHDNPRDPDALKVLAMLAAKLEPEQAAEEQLTRAQFFLWGAGA